MSKPTGEFGGKSGCVGPIPHDHMTAVIQSNVSHHADDLLNNLNNPVNWPTVAHGNRWSSTREQGLN